MSFLTKVITDTSPDFGDNPQIVTENGQPSSVDVENLSSNTGYWTKAEIWQNGVLNDTSEVESFQTLPAGTITLTHQSSVRSGSNYIVTYTYTSTYALSSSVLTCGVSVSSQGVIAGNTITFTVSGLVPGDAYICQINTIDMYGESAQTSITLIMPVVNEVSITGTTTTYSTVVCELDYTIDGGFTQGWVDYWDENADPSTDQPQGHSSFIDGADTCTITGLTDGTTYQLRATIYYGGYVNYVVSSVVTATTVTNYNTKYFTIKNTGLTDSAITLWASTTLPSGYSKVYVSLDNGTTWTGYIPPEPSDNYITTLATLTPGSEMLMKHTGAMYPARVNISGQNAKLSGNIASLCFGDNFTGTQTMPQNAYANLFSLNNASTRIVYDLNNLSFASYTSVSQGGLSGMFRNHTAQTTSPDLSTITSVGEGGMQSMFYGCVSLTTPPDLSNVTSVDNYGMTTMFNGCAALTTPPDLGSITTIGNNGMELMFNGCTALATPPDMSSVTSVGNNGLKEMFYGCGLTTPPDLSNITTFGNAVMLGMFRECVHLTTAPDLSGITTITSSGMKQMFYNCRALTTTPDLSNVTSVEIYGMQEMFYGCTHITTAPDLSGITTIGNYAMDGMFVRCTALTTAPNISSIKTVSVYGMRNMFNGCYYLTTSPDLRKITRVNSYGMNGMFEGCSKLNTVYAPTITWNTGNTLGWLKNVDYTGTLYADSSIISTIPDNDASGCPSGWTKVSI